jgi:hypothetical protein
MAQHLDANTRLVVQHFDDFVNRRDLTAIGRDVAEDFYDHDRPGGKPCDRATDRAMMADRPASGRFSEEKLRKRL